MDGKFEVESDKVSKFNSAGLINLRFHSLWIDCNNHARKGKFAAWNADLDRIWCELAGDVTEILEKDKKKEKTKDDFDLMRELNQASAKVGPLKNWKQSEGFETINKDKESNKSLQYDSLMAKEIFLRRLFNKQGKGTAYADPEDDWE